MKILGALCLCGVLGATAAFPAEHFEDQEIERCDGFLERLNAVLGDFETSAGNLQDDFARYSYLSYRQRFFRLKSHRCLRVLYHNNEEWGPAKDDDGRDWENNWPRSR